MYERCVGDAVPQSWSKDEKDWIDTARLSEELVLGLYVFCFERLDTCNRLHLELNRTYLPC